MILSKKTEIKSLIKKANIQINLANKFINENIKPIKIIKQNSKLEIVKDYIDIHFTEYPLLHEYISYDFEKFSNEYNKFNKKFKTYQHDLIDDLQLFIENNYFKHCTLYFDLPFSYNNIYDMVVDNSVYSNKETIYLLKSITNCLTNDLKNTVAFYTYSHDYIENPLKSFRDFIMDIKVTDINQNLLEKIKTIISYNFD